MAFIATARAATLVQHTLPDSMPDGLLPTRTCAHQPAQLDQVRGIHALHCVGAEPLGHAVMTAALCSEPAEQQFISQEEVRLGAAPSSLQMPGLRAAKRVPADVMTGLTPEHMLYWVSQADVAQQLRCTEAQGDDVIAASHQALANPLGAAPAEEGSHPLQDSAAAARSDATVAEIVARQPEEQKVARKTVRQKHARPGSVKKASRKQLSC